MKTSKTNLDVFNENKKLVYSIINRYRKNSFEYKTNIDWDEIEQVGLIALFKAVQGYQDGKGNFKNYAISAIKNAITRQLDFDNKTINNLPVESAYKVPADNTDLDLKLDYRTVSKNLLNAINTLSISDTSKDILRMRAKGMTLQSIGDKLGKSYQAVAEVIRQQSKNLRQKLSK